MTADDRPNALDQWIGQRDNWLLSVLLIINACIAWIGRSPGVLTGQDDARYITLAHSLRIGEYRDLMWPGAPWHHMYPPGYPALLTLWTIIGGERFDWLVSLQVLMSTATVALVYFAARRAFSPMIALGAVVLCVVNPSLLDLAGRIDSEVPLAFCLALVVWASTVLAPGRLQAAVILAAAVAAPMIRSVGVVLPVAVVLYWILHRRYREAVLAAVLATIVVGGLLWWTLADSPNVPGSSYAADVKFMAPLGNHTSKYVAFLREMFRRVVANLAYYPSQGLTWILPTPTIAGTLIDNVVLSVALSLSTVAGLVRAYRRQSMAMAIILFFIGLLLVWPYQVARFLVPLLPVLYPVILAGAAALAANGGSRARTLAVSTAVLLIAGTGAFRTAIALESSARCRRGDAIPEAACLTPSQASFMAATRFVKQSLPSNARIVSAKSEPLYFYTGHITVPYQPLTILDSAGFWRALQRDSAEYILLGDLHWSEPFRLAGRVKERCRDLQLVAVFPPRAYLFRLPPAASSDSGSAATPVRSPGSGSPTLSACEAIAKYGPALVER